ncbi:hypothetical protein ACFFRR_008206 [Megaselia abdita]
MNGRKCGVEFKDGFENMEILKYIDFIKTTVTVTGGAKWQLSDKTAPFVIEDDQNCVSNDSGICEDLCYFLKCGELLEFFSAKEEEWELLRSKLSQIVDKRQRKELTDLCNVCFTELDLSDYKRSTKCYVCEKFICRGRKCSRWVPKEASWECELCSTTKESCAKTNEWLEKQVLTNIKNNCPSRIARSEVYIPISAQYDINDNESSPGFLSFETRSFAHSSTIPVEEKMRVRDYIENLLSTMIDGMPLDDVLVSKMSDDPNYLKLFHTFHSQLTTQIYELETYLYAFYRDLPLPDSDGELTGLSHVKIKQLIDAITRELKLTFKNGAVRSITPTGEQTTQTEIEANNNSPYFHSKKYQELLATAVLNKITDPQLAAENLTETEKLVRSSFRNSFRKPNGQVSNESSSLTDNLLSARSFTPDEVHSDLFTEPVYENLTGRESVIGYLKDHTIALPELESDEYPASGEEDEIEEEFDSLNSDNWLLRKKKFGHDVPSVGMLVPAPKEDIRALIGDKTADEISDLSDNESSEDDFNNDELVFSNHRIQSDSLISGKHTAGLIDHLIDGSSLISVTSLNEGDPELVDIKNNNVSNKAALNGFHDIEKPVINLENGKMPETPQALNTDIILPPPSGFADDGEPTSPDSVSMKSLETESVEEDIETERLRHLVPGSIAEREYKKWTNAVDMPNNPYAPDALKKRLSGSSENFMDLPNISQEEKESVDHTDAPKLDTNDNDKEYERYSRDYYINLSKCASGRRSTSPSNKDNDVTGEEDAVNNNELFAARPIEIKEYSEEELEEIKSPLSPVSLSYTHDSLTPSEDSDTMRVYDLKKQETSFIPQRPVSLHISSEKTVNPISPSRSYESLSPTKANINFKSLQPKRKLIEPSDVLYASDQEEVNLITPSSPESPRLIIEEDLVNAMPSVKALAQVFLTKPQEKAEKPKEQINMFEECNEDVQVVEGTIKPEEPPKLVMKIPEPQGEDKNVLTPGKLKDNIAFFENLKNQ